MFRKLIGNFILACVRKTDGHADADGRRKVRHGLLLMMDMELNKHRNQIESLNKRIDALEATAKRKGGKHG